MSDTKPQIRSYLAGGARVFVCVGLIGGVATSGWAYTPFEAWCRWLYSLGPHPVPDERRDMTASYLLGLHERGELRRAPILPGSPPEPDNSARS